MDIWAIIGGVGIIIGIIAGVVQVLDYLQKQREKLHAPSKEDLSPTQPPVPQTPHNLPPRSEFIGREKEKARVHIRRMLKRENPTAPPSGATRPASVWYSQVFKLDGTPLGVDALLDQVRLAAQTLVNILPTRTPSGGCWRVS